MSKREQSTKTKYALLDVHFLLSAEQGMTVMSITHSDVGFSNELGIIGCASCSQRMSLSCISLGADGYDLRTYDCEQCKRSKTFVVKDKVAPNS